MSARPKIKTLPLGFQPQFAASVQSGEKTQTVRARVPEWARRAHYNAEDLRVSLWRGLITKNCQLLGRGVVVDVQTIAIMRRSIIIGEKHLSNDERQCFARMDGFECHQDMWAFFYDRLNATGEMGAFFLGYLLRWRLLDGGDQ